jgi:hypothetical protein
VTHDQVRRLLFVRAPAPCEQAAVPLEDHLRSVGDWRGVDAVIERASAAWRCRIVLATLGRSRSSARAAQC